MQVDEECLLPLLLHILMVKFIRLAYFHKPTFDCSSLLLNQLGFLDVEFLGRTFINILNLI
jgi:hypothetical protein